jgi:hypothetical protein
MNNEINVGQVEMVARNMVKMIAPKELPYFSEIWEVYHSQLQTQVTNNERSDRENHDNTGFYFVGGEDLLTSSIITAVITGLTKLIEIYYANRKTKSSSLEDKKRMNTSDTESERILLATSVNFVGLRRELIQSLRSFGISQKRAELIANSFVSTIAQDDSIILKSPQTKNAEQSG